MTALTGEKRERAFYLTQKHKKYMVIYGTSNNKILEVEVDDNSYRHRVVMGENSLTLYFSLPAHVEIPVGAWCQFEGTKYYLERPEALKMEHNRCFNYTVMMESDQAKAKRWKFRNTVDGRIKFPLTATPREHLQMFVDNMNRRDSGWSIGKCITDVEHLISYDNNYCWEALGLMATEFNTEFEIVGKTVSLGKVEYNKSNPLALSYGNGNGFRSGVGRTNSSDKMPVEILFVQGGTENIDPSKEQQSGFKNKELLLPVGQTIGYDGEHYSDEAGYSSSSGRMYVVDDKGMSIRRSDKSLSSYAEDCLDGTEHYPKRVGTISSVVVEDEKNNFYDIVDTSIPEALDYSACQIDGETMTVIFQSGMLAGKEFECNYFHTAKNNKAARRFEIVPQEIDGETMPNNTFKPKAGDKYAVFHCALPQSYICDNQSKSGAAWDMFRAAVRYMFDNEEQQFSFTGELDGIWSKQDWTNIGGRIVLGGFVLFTDKNFQKDGVLVRITGIKDYINNPHSPVIELSNKTQSAGFSSELAKLENDNVTTEKQYGDGISFTKRRWRDAKESLGMLNDLLNAGFDNFTQNINPITIETMAMLVGDESLQYRFVGNTTTPSTVNHTFKYDSTTKVFSTTAGYIQHMTLGIDTLSSSHEPKEYKYWLMSAFTSAPLSDGSKKYYVYIKASKTQVAVSGSSVLQAVLYLSETAIKLEGVSGYYHFLVGILNSEYEGERSFVTLYGFTEILPGRITTDRIVSGDGQSFFDMLANAMKLGDLFKFNINGDGKLVLKGTVVQSQGGEDESPIGCYRGVWNSSYVYYYGDEVVYTSNGSTATYRYINENPTSGNPPTNTTYWQVKAQGKNGVDAVSVFKSTAFIRLPNGVTPEAPAGGSWGSPIPTSYVTDGPDDVYYWSDGIPAGDYILWASTRVFYSDNRASLWSTPRQMTDTATYDVEFAKRQPNDATPPVPTTANRHGGSGIQIWFDPDLDSSQNFTQMYWRAEREYKNGEWSDWTIVRIKGEDGDDAEFLKVEVNNTTSALVRKTVLNNGTTYAPATAVFKVIKIVGDKREELASLPTGYYMICTRVSDTNTAPSSKITTVPYSIVTGTLFNPSYTYARMDLYDNNNEIIASAYISTVEDGEDGNDGKNGDYYEHRYAVGGSPTTAPAINSTSRYPSTSSVTWSTVPPMIGSLQYLWMTTAKISGSTDGLLTNWSTPVRQTAIDALNLGENLVDNSEAVEIIDVESSGLYNDSTPPSQFKETKKVLCRIPPSGTILSCQVRVKVEGCRFKSGGASVLVYMNGSNTWPAIGQKTGITANGTYDLVNEGLVYNWNGGTMYRPIVVRLNNFYAGGTVSIERVKVEINPRCTEWSLSEADKRGPAIMYRKEYDSTKTYVGNRLHIDCVKYNGVYYAARSDAGTFVGIVPTNPDYWNEFGGQFESVATELLLAEFAYIENLGVRDLQTAESGKRVHISADENAMTIYDEDGETSAVFSGDQFSDSQLFGGADKSITPTNTNSSYQTGNALHPNMVYTQTLTNSTFTFDYAGVCNGRVVIGASFTKTLVGSTTSGPSQMFYVQVEVLLDNSVVGRFNITDKIDSNDNSGSTIVDFSRGIIAGTHTLKTRVTISVPYYTSGSLNVTAKSTFSNVKASASIRMSRYFANGQAVGCSTEQFIESIIQNNKMMHKVRCGDAGLEIADGTFKIRIGGVVYTATVATVSGEKVLKLT